MCVQKGPVYEAIDKLLGLAGLSISDLSFEGVYDSLLQWYRDKVAGFASSN